MATAISQLNGAVQLTTTADGDLLPITDVSDTTENANGTTKPITLNNLAAGIVASTAGAAALAAKADYNAVRDETGTSFTLTAANHSNRRTDAVNAAAITATWDTGHGMSIGDSGMIVQTGAGAVTVTAGTGTVTLSPNVAAASTTADGSWLTWEYMGADEILITGRGSAPTGGSSPVTVFTGVGGTHTGSTTETTLATVSIPGGTIGPTGRVEWSLFYGYSGTAGTKSMRVVFGGSTVRQDTLNNLTLSAQMLGMLWNNNSETAQIGLRALDGAVNGYTTGNTNSGDTYIKDTTASVDLLFRVVLANAADSCTLTRYEVRVWYGA